MVAFRDLWYRHPANNSTQYPCIAAARPHQHGGQAHRAGLPGVRQPMLDPHGRVPQERRRVAGRLALATCGCTAPTRCTSSAPPTSRVGSPAPPSRAWARSSASPVPRPSHFYGKLYGRTGIIYIQDYWKRHGETTPTGDHIDVWNGYRSSTKWLMEWFSWLGYHSNYVQAKEIWFWDVKIAATWSCAARREACMRYLIAMLVAIVVTALVTRVREPAPGEHGGRPLHLREPRRDGQSRGRRLYAEQPGGAAHRLGDRLAHRRPAGEPPGSASLRSCRQASRQPRIAA